MSFEIGDKVRTTKGCRVKGVGGELEIVKVGSKWRDYDSVSCKKEDGTIRIYLVKNLVRIES